MWRNQELLRSAGISVIGAGMSGKSFKQSLKWAIWKVSPRLFHKLAKKEGSEYSISVYSGDSPISLSAATQVANPVLTWRSVTDRPAAYVADPFMFKSGDRWYMFFEVLSKMERRGVIGSAYSDDGYEWVYNKIVLVEPYHLAYPYVFSWNDRIYMMPDSGGHGVRLYEAKPFPDKWKYVKTILDSRRYVDSSIFEHKGRWWLLTASSPKGVAAKSLHIFYADNPVGNWREHPVSPVLEANNSIARPGGRVVACEGKLYRFAQDGVPHYGSSVRAFEILNLTTREYEEREVNRSPVLSAGKEQWNLNGMHHVDAHLVNSEHWFACVDGWFDNRASKKIHVS
jgi:hypothetical protein